MVAKRASVAIGVLSYFAGLLTGQLTSVSQNAPTQITSVNKPTREKIHKDAKIRIKNVHGEAGVNMVGLSAAVEPGQQVTVYDRTDHPALKHRSLARLTARYICTDKEGDLYEIFWSQDNFSPVVPVFHEYDGFKKIIKTGGEKVVVFENDGVEIQVIDN